MAKNTVTNNDSNVFDPFDVLEEKSPKANNSPWVWSSTGDNVDTSFDSVQFSTEEFGYNPFSAASSSNKPQPAGGKNASVQKALFPSDPMATLSSEVEETGETTVRVSIRETFSSVYDDAGSTPSCHLEGSIFVQAVQFDRSKTASFCVVLQDEHGHIDNLDEFHTISSNVTTAADREVKRSIFQVSLPQNSLSEVPVATYTCNPQLRPIPMLVKSRVQVTDDVSRVGFKVRANPSNAEALNNLIILIAVPPFVQGETVKMSRKGGVWDEMKRTICWTIEKLEPGEVLEIQAQFQSGKKQNLAHVDLQFPILVRADVPRLFSGIDISTDYGDKETSAKSNVTQCTRILHRKV